MNHAETAAQSAMKYTDAQVQRDAREFFIQNSDIIQGFLAAIRQEVKPVNLDIAFAELLMLTFTNGFVSGINCLAKSVELFKAAKQETETVQ